MIALSASNAPTQRADPATAAASRNVSLPEFSSLVTSLKDHQEEISKVVQHYTWHALQTVNETDGKGAVRKSSTLERETFISHGRRYSRVIARDGKPLDAAAMEKENARVDKIIAEREAKPPRPSTSANPFSPSGILKFCKLSNERWEVFKGRRVVAIDFAGLPEIRTKDRFEDAMKKLAGTLWIDPEARQMVAMHIHVEENIKVSGGLVASFEKGSSLEFEQARVHDQVWLPSRQVQHVSARILLVKGFHRDIVTEFRDYREYKVGVKILDGVTPVEEESL